MKYHASFESFSSENAKSLFGPSVPSRPAVCTYSVAAPRLARDSSTFSTRRLFPSAEVGVGRVGLTGRDVGQVAEQV